MCNVNCQRVTLKHLSHVTQMCCAFDVSYIYARCMLCTWLQQYV